MSYAFTPRENLLRIYDRWWLIVLFGLLGGLIGRTVFAFSEPVYASSFEFAFTIDPAQTGPLSEREYDRLQHSAGRIIFSADILDVTLEIAGQQGMHLDRATLVDITLQEWRGSIWEYSVLHPDPEVAYRLASIWSETAANELIVAHTHALEAQTIRAYLDALAACNDPAAAPGSTDCVPPSSDIDQEIADLTARWEEAVDMSRMLIPAIAFEQTRTAELPARPITTGQATVVFSGAVIGMLIGVWLANFPGFRADPLSP
ncbi:MAG TPA: hypothetical protein VMN57_10630 [Anaerolineales bacterium]|nr:hypothetical protein [Anaerolineales bacterium]